MTNLNIVKHWKAFCYDDLEHFLKTAIVSGSSLMGAISKLISTMLARHLNVIKVSDYAVAVIQVKYIFKVQQLLTGKVPELI